MAASPSAMPPIPGFTPLSLRTLSPFWGSISEHRIIAPVQHVYPSLAEIKDPGQIMHLAVPLCSS